MPAIARFKTPRPAARAWSQILLVAACAMAGCSSSSGPPLGQVSGTVTLDGQTVADAEVLFVPASGNPSVGKTDQKGQYTLAYDQKRKGAVIGKHTVRITKLGEPGSPNDTKNLLPEKYNQKSPLTAEVKEGKNSFDFKLTSGR